jgi:hypothetical protein
MRLRRFGLWLLLAAALLTSPGCFFGGPWGRWHRCGYESSGPGDGSLPNEKTPGLPPVDPAPTSR